MKKILVVILSFSLFNFVCAYEYDEKVNELLRNETIEIKEREVLISLNEWDKLSEREKKKFLEMMNIYTRKHIKVSVSRIVEKETGNMLAEIGVSDIVLYDYNLLVEDESKED